MGDHADHPEWHSISEEQVLGLSSVAGTVLFDPVFPLLVQSLVGYELQVS